MKKFAPFRNLVILIILSFIAYTFIGKIAGFQDISLVFKNFAPIFLVLAIIAAGLTYLANGLKLKILLEAQGYKFKFRDLIKFGMVGSFAIHFLPVGNFGESALNFYLLKQKGVKTSSSLSLFLTRLIFDYFAFFSLFVIALAFIPVHPSLNLKIKIGFFVVLFALIAGSLYINYLLKRPKKFIKIALPILKYLKKSLHFIQYFENNQDSDNYFTRLANDLQTEMNKNMTSKPGVKLLLASLFYWLADISILYFSLLGLGVVLNPFAVISAYVIAIIAGIISFLPAGIGAIEGTLILILNSFSVNLPTISFSVLAYRFISLWLAMPLGLLAFYRLDGAKIIFNKKEEEKN